MDSKVYAISKEIMEGHGDDLFDHIAACLAEFMKERNIDKESI
jgi:hexokinase